MESSEKKEDKSNHLTSQLKSALIESKSEFNKKRNNTTEILDIQADTSIASFVTLEQECDDVVNGLNGDPSLDNFRVEYEKLFRALKKSHTQEKVLAAKCRELGTEIEGNASKVQNALEQSQKNQNTIGMLQLDAKKKSDLLDATKKREILITKTVDKLQEEVTKISSRLERERSSTMKQTEDYEKVTRERDKLQNHLNESANQAKKLKKESSDSLTRIETLEREYAETRRTNGSLIDEINEHKRQIEREAKRSQNFEKDIDDFKSKLQDKTKDYIDLQYTSVLTGNKSAQLRKDLEDTNKKMEERAGEIEKQSYQIRHLTDALESQKEKIGVIARDLHESRQTLKIANATQNRTSSEKSQIQRKFDNEHKAMLRMQQLIDDTKSSLSSSHTEIQSLQKERDQLKVAEDLKKRQIGVLEREKNIYIGKTQRSEQKVKQADEDGFQQEQVVLSLEKELVLMKEESEKLKQRIHHLENKNGKHNDELAEKRAGIDRANNEVRIRDVEVQEMRKESQQWEQKFKEQHQICNNLRAEQGKSSRNTIETQKEVDNLKDQSIALNQKIKTMRSELLVKDESLVKEHFDHRKEKAHKEQLNNEVSRLKQQIMQQEDIIQKQVTEIRRLCSTLRKMDEDTLVQRKEYDGVINERDVLGAQLICQNDELALLHEKVKIQDNTLQKGEQQYQARLEDMQLLKLKVQDARHELDVLKGGSVNVCELSRELIHKEKELVHERVKVKALSEELENPLNVHRWRNLQGSDPTSFESMQKIELLQKRLIKKTEQVIEKDTIIQEQEKENLTLKKQCARNHENDVVGKLSIRQNEVREKERQMKAMAGELNMNLTQTNEYKQQIDKLNNELHTLKHQQFEQKKKEALTKEKQLSWLASNMKFAENTSLVENVSKNSEVVMGPQKPKFVGGGFAVK